MPGGSDSIRNQPTQSLNPFDTFFKEESKTSKKNNITTHHHTASNDSKHLEQQHNNQNTINIINKSTGEDQKDLFDFVHLHTPIRLMRERQTDTRSTFQKRFYAFCDHFRTYKEASLDNFDLDSSNGVVKGLLDGKLNNYQMARVMDRLRYLSVYGNFLEKPNARKVLLDVAERYAEAIGVPKGDTGSIRCAQKLGVYYAKVMKEYAECAKKYPIDAYALAEKLLSLDLYIYSTGLSSKDRMIEELNDLEFHKFSSIEEARSVFERAFEHEDRKRNDIKRSLQQKLTESFVKENGGHKSDVSFDIQSITSMADRFSGKAKESKQNLHITLAVINKAICQKKNEQATEALIILLKHKNTSRVAAEFCRDYFRVCLTGTKEFPLPGSIDPVPLKDIIALPILATALQGALVNNEAGKLSQYIEARVDKDGMSHFTSALVMAENWNRQS